MKTKAIFALLILLVSALTPSLHRCICPNQAPTGVASTITVISAAEDICKDCGHSTECCFNHQDSPVVASGSPAGPVAEWVVLAMETFPFNTELHLAPGLYSKLNKAPPLCLQQSPILLQQKLLI